MEQEEKEICAYLKGVPGEFISGREICRRAGGKWRFRDDPLWAMPYLTQMLEKKLIESDATGHYRLIIKHDKKNPKGKWVSPQVRRILEKSGKDFTHIIPDEDLEEGGLEST